MCCTTRASERRRIQLKRMRDESKNHSTFSRRRYDVKEKKFNSTFAPKHPQCTRPIEDLAAAAKTSRQVGSHRRPQPTPKRPQWTLKISPLCINNFPFSNITSRRLPNYNKKKFSSSRKPKIVQARTFHSEYSRQNIQPDDASSSHFDVRGGTKDFNHLLLSLATANPRILMLKISLNLASSGVFFFRTSSSSLFYKMPIFTSVFYAFQCAFPTLISFAIGVKTLK